MHDVAREGLIDAAVTAATAQGFKRRDSEFGFVIVHGGEEWQDGASGAGDGVVKTGGDLSTICHEFGHCLGFHHSHGFATGYPSVQLIIAER